MTTRALVLVPPPQVKLHSPHGFQSPTLQSTGHWSVLQTVVSSNAGHKAPPFSGSSMTSRALHLVPPPQVKLHSPHGFQSPTLQSTGHWSVLQTIVSSRAGHLFPPYSVSTMTSLALVLVPPP